MQKKKKRIIVLMALVLLVLTGCSSEVNSVDDLKTATFKTMKEAKYDDSYYYIINSMDNQTLSEENAKLLVNLANVSSNIAVYQLDLADIANQELTTGEGYIGGISTIKIEETPSIVSVDATNDNYFTVYEGNDEINELLTSNLIVSYIK